METTYLHIVWNEFAVAEKMSGCFHPILCNVAQRVSCLNNVLLILMPILFTIFCNTYENVFIIIPTYISNLSLEHTRKSTPPLPSLQEEEISADGPVGKRYE